MTILLNDIIELNPINIEGIHIAAQGSNREALRFTFKLSDNDINDLYYKFSDTSNTSKISILEKAENGESPVFIYKNFIILHEASIKDALVKADNGANSSEKSIVITLAQLTSFEIETLKMKEDIKTTTDNVLLSLDSIAMLYETLNQFKGDKIINE